MSSKDLFSARKGLVIRERGQRGKAPNPAFRRQALGRGLENLFPASEIKHKTLLGIEKIKPNPRQPRRVFDKALLRELANSIRKNGLIQPVVVRKKGSNHEIVAGERRWRAAGLAGLHEIPVWILKQEQINPFLSLVENLQREDLNPIELATAYKALLEEQNISQEKLAEHLSLPRTTLTNSLRLLKLSRTAQELVLKGQISFAVAKVLLQEKDPHTQSKWARHFAKHRTGVRKATALLSSKKEKSPAKQPKKQHKTALKLLKDRRGVKAQIHFRKKGGELRLRFFSDRELNMLMSLLLDSQ